MDVVLVQESMDMKKRKDTAALHTIRTAASELDLPVKYVSKHVLNTLTDNRPHQGIMLDCGELPYANMDVLPTVDELQALQGTGTAPPVWLVVDEVSDPVCTLSKFPPPCCAVFFPYKLHTFFQHLLAFTIPLVLPLSSWRG